MFQNKKAVIFDLDGTLIDSLGIWNQVDEVLLSELDGPSITPSALSRFREQELTKHRLSPSPYLEYCRSLGTLCRASLSAEEIHRRRYEISRQLLRSHVHFKPQAAATVKLLNSKGIRLVIATTTKRANIDVYSRCNVSMMQELNLETAFEFILTRENVQHIKPDPQIYRLAIERLGLAPAECLVFEDSIAGVQAAQAAQLDVAVIEDRWSVADREQLKKQSLAYFVNFEQVIEAILATNAK